MDRIGFADESSIHGNTKCFGIGVLSLNSEVLAGFERRYSELKSMHNAGREPNWEEIRNRFSDINLLLDCLDQILRSHTGRFDVVVVKTSIYRNWNRRRANREKAFYVIYTQLLKHIAKRGGTLTSVFIDERLEKYALNHETMEIIGNRMLNLLASTGRLKVQRVSSICTPGVQVADLLTGLVVAAHKRRLDPSASLNPGKKLAIERAARLFGWDDLCYDTRPNSRFNIWHFPIEYRSDPKTREVKSPFRIPDYVVRGDLG